MFGCRQGEYYGWLRAEYESVEVAEHASAVVCCWGSPCDAPMFEQCLPMRTGCTGAPLYSKAPMCNSIVEARIGSVHSCASSNYGDGAGSSWHPQVEARHQWCRSYHVRHDNLDPAMSRLVMQVVG